MCFMFLNFNFCVFFSRSVFARLRDVYFKMDVNVEVFSFFLSFLKNLVLFFVVNCIVWNFWVFFMLFVFFFVFVVVVIFANFSSDLVVFFYVAFARVDFVIVLIVCCFVFLILMVLFFVCFLVFLEIVFLIFFFGNLLRMNFKIDRAFVSFGYKNCWNLIFLFFLYLIVLSVFVYVLVMWNCFVMFVLLFLFGSVFGRCLNVMELMWMSVERMSLVNVMLLLMSDVRLLDVIGMFVVWRVRIRILLVLVEDIGICDVGCVMWWLRWI